MIKEFWRNIWFIAQTLYRIMIYIWPVNKSFEVDIAWMILRSIQNYESIMVNKLPIIYAFISNYKTDILVITYSLLKKNYKYFIFKIWILLVFQVQSRVYGGLPRVVFHTPWGLRVVFHTVYGIPSGVNPRTPLIGPG